MRCLAACRGQVVSVYAHSIDARLGDGQEAGRHSPGGRVGGVHLDDRVAHLGHGAGYRSSRCGVTRGVDEHRVDAVVVGVVEGVNDLSGDVGVKQLHLYAQFSRVGPYLVVDLVQRVRSEYFHLGFAPHVHSRTVNHKRSGHRILPKSWSCFRQR